MHKDTGKKVEVLARAWSAAWLIPGKQKLPFLVNPVDATRYLEFAYLLRLLSDRDVRPSRVLDVSSPVIISYMLSSMGSMVIKTDINQDERKYVRPGPRLSFQQENATKLSFPDDSFDLVCSISVLEHIHENYMEALREMIRVTNCNGLIYVTFPVCREFMEERLDEPIYSDQKQEGKKTFFQYRFDGKSYDKIIQNLPADVEIVSEDIFWERWNGLYDWLMQRLRRDWGGLIIKHLRAGFLNLALGPIFFESKAGSFERPKSFGNAHLLLKKKGSGYQ